MFLEQHIRISGERLE